MQLSSIKISSFAYPMNEPLVYKFCRISCVLISNLTLTPPSETFPTRPQKQNVLGNSYEQGWEKVAILTLLIFPKPKQPIGRTCKDEIILHEVNFTINMFFVLRQLETRSNPTPPSENREKVPNINFNKHKNNSRDKTEINKRKKKSTCYYSFIWHRVFYT